MSSGSRAAASEERSRLQNRISELEQSAKEREEKFIGMLENREKRLDRGEAELRQLIRTLKNPGP